MVNYKEIENGYALYSPSGTAKVFVTCKNGGISYSAESNGKIRFENAPMGIIVGKNEERDSAVDYATENEFCAVEETSVRGNKFAVYGRQENREENSNRFKIGVKRGDAKYFLHFAVFDNGVAFRYSFEKDAGTYVFGETTQIVLPEKSKVYASFGCRKPGCNKRLNGKDALCYECTYDEYDPAEKFIPTPYVAEKDCVTDPDYYNYVLMPLTVKYRGGGYGAIAEAEVFDYAGSSLRPFGNYRFGLNTAAGKTQFETFKAENRVVTPWRVLMFAEDLNGLYNNGIIDAVTEKIEKDFSFVKPGRSVWHWHAELEQGNFISYDLLKKYTLTAAKMGFEYNIIDDGWKKLDLRPGCKCGNGAGAVKKLVKLGKRYGVGQIVWAGFIYNELNPNDFCDKGSAETSAKDFLDFCGEAGASGVKVDFFRTESDVYSGCNMYEYIADYCADRKMICDFHGASKPTGLSAKYKNELSREGIRGMENYFYTPECYKDISYAFSTLTFVRGIAGHGDWTPFVQDGIGLSSILLTDSPINAISATCEELLNHPAKEFIKSIPASFDKTAILPDSSFGKYIAAAKEKCGMLFYAGMNASEKAYLQVLKPGDFLPKGVYRMELWYDTEAGLRTESRLLQEHDCVNVNVLPYRGFAARFASLEFDRFGGDAETPVKIKSYNNEEVYYTTDGSDPANSKKAKEYVGKIKLKKSCNLRACAVRNGKVTAQLNYRFNKVKK